MGGRKDGPPLRTAKLHQKLKNYLFFYADFKKGKLAKTFFCWFFDNF